MKVFLDSSAYAKRFIEEEGSDKIEKILSDANELALSIICIPELISAMNRRLREKNLSRKQYDQIKLRLSQELDDIQIIQINEAVIKSTIILLEKNILRAMDAIHISSALEWKADIFITSDRRQIKAAKNRIKKVEFI